MICFTLMHMNFMTSNMELTEIDRYYSGKCYKGLLHKVFIHVYPV